MKNLIETAKKLGCYRVTLYCDEKNKDFYTKCGLAKIEIQIVKYF